MARRLGLLEEQSRRGGAPYSPSAGDDLLYRPVGLGQPPFGTGFGDVVVEEEEASPSVIAVTGAITSCLFALCAVWGSAFLFETDVYPLLRWPGPPGDPLGALAPLAQWTLPAAVLSLGYSRLVGGGRGAQGLSPTSLSPLGDFVSISANTGSRQLTQPAVLAGEIGLPSAAAFFLVTCAAEGVIFRGAVLQSVVTAVRLGSPFQLLGVEPHALLGMDPEMQEPLLARVLGALTPVGSPTHPVPWGILLPFLALSAGAFEAWAYTALIRVTVTPPPSLRRGPAPC